MEKRFFLPSLLFFLIVKNSEAHNTTYDLVSNIDFFGVQLFQAFHKLNREDNGFLSNIAFAAGAALVFNGAKGETLQDMEVSFRFPSADILNPTFRTLLDKIKDPGYIHVILKMYVTHDLQVNDALRTLGTDLFFTQVYNVDFTKACATTSMINMQFAEESHDILQNGLPEDTLTPETSLIYLGGFYAKGQWVVPFDPSETTFKSFSLSNNEKVDVETMSIQCGVLNYYEDTQLGVKVLELPFDNADSDAAMVIILPLKIDGLDEIPAQLGKLKDVPWSKANTKVSLPKFQITARWDLAKLLAQVFI